MDKELIAQPQPGIVPAATSIEALIARAIDRGVPVETMERLLVMRTQLKAEAAKEAYFLALAALQNELPIIPKTKRVNYGEGRAKYSYAPLDDIIPIVQPLVFKHGFSVTLNEGVDEAGKPVAIATAHHIEGHSEDSRFPIVVDASARMNAAQQQASARTYAKRYAYCNVLGIVTGDEDDDAQTSSDPPADRRPGKVVVVPASQGKPVQAPPPRPAGKPITDKQIGRLCAIAKAGGHHGDDVDLWLQAQYGFTSKTHITMNIYDEICNRLADKNPLLPLAGAAEPPPPGDEDFPAEWNQ